MKKVFELYLKNKYKKQNIFYRVEKNNIDKFNYDINRILEDNYFNKLESLYCPNKRNGIYVNDIIQIDNNTEDVYFSFRARIILNFNIKNHRLFFDKEEFKMCMFHEEDYELMNLFLSNVVLYKNDLGNNLESYEIN